MNYDLNILEGTDIQFLKHQFLENCRSQSDACNTLISSKKHAPITFWKGLIIPQKICLVSPMAIRVTRSVSVKLNNDWCIKKEPECGK